MRAEALPADLGVFCAITFAQSFHWMQREHVARAVHGMLEPERGRLILISAYTRSGVEPTAPTEHPVVPRAAITSLIETFLGSVRRAGASSLPEGTPWDEEEVLARAGFSAPIELLAPDGRTFTRTIDDVVASVYAVSSSAPHLFAGRLERFESELRALLIGASPTGLFSEQAADNQLRLFVPRPAS